MHRSKIFLVLGLAAAARGLSVSGADEVVTVSPAASYAHENDGHAGNPLAALADGKEPAASGDRTIPRFTFWNHKGTAEWVQLNFDRPLELSSVEVYWFDDRPNGGCRVPESWEISYENAYSWSSVEEATGRGPTKFGVKRDKYNRVEFKPVLTGAVRIEVQQQPGFSSGILEVKLNGRIQKLGSLGVVGSQVGEAVPFDYPKTRIAIAAAVEAFGSAEPQHGQSLQQLDDLAQTWMEARIGIGFGDTMAIGRLNQASRRLAQFEKQYAAEAILSRLEKRLPEACLDLMIRLDWLEQDGQSRPGENFLALTTRVVKQLTAVSSHRDASLQERIDELSRADVSPFDQRWMDVYVDACDHRREDRIGPHLHKFPRIVFTRHHDVGGQHYAYTEDVSDSPYDDNNRGQLFPQPLFQMNPDGTGQTEFYGNNSWFPTTILHARGIPGTQRIICVLSGHHTYQKGKLALIDPARGRQENAGVQLIAPLRVTEAVKIDKYGYQGEQFQ